MPSTEQVAKSLHPRSIISYAIAAAVVGIIGVVANWWTQGELNDAAILVGGWIVKGIVIGFRMLGAMISAGIEQAKS